jgi:hypothetical protein
MGWDGEGRELTSLIFGTRSRRRFCRESWSDGEMKIRKRVEKQR